MNGIQTISRKVYHCLDNRVTCILQQRWPANEISQWVGVLKGQQQAVACAILHRRHPRPVSLALPAITHEVTVPFQARANRPTKSVYSVDRRPLGRRRIEERLTPVVIGQFGTIRCATTGITLWIALDCPAGLTNLEAVAQLNPTYKPAMHQVIADHR